MEKRRKIRRGKHRQEEEKGKKEREEEKEDEKDEMREHSQTGDNRAQRFSVSPGSPSVGPESSTEKFHG